MTIFIWIGTALGFLLGLPAYAQDSGNLTPSDDWIVDGVQLIRDLDSYDRQNPVPADFDLGVELASATGEQKLLLYRAHLIALIEANGKSPEDSLESFEKVIRAYRYDAQQQSAVDDVALANSMLEYGKHCFGMDSKVILLCLRQQLSQADIVPNMQALLLAMQIIVYVRTGDAEAALENLRTASWLLRAAEVDDIFLLKLQQAKVFAYMFARDYGGVVAAIRDEFSVSKRVNLPLSMEVWAYNMAVALTYGGAVDEGRTALAFFDRIASRTKPDDNYWVIYSQRLHGNQQILQKNYAKGRAHYQRVYANLIEAPELVVSTNLVLARTAVELGYIEEAVAHLEEARSHPGYPIRPTDEKQAHLLDFRIANHIGDSKEAFAGLYELYQQELELHEDKAKSITAELRKISDAEHVAQEMQITLRDEQAGLRSRLLDRQRELTALAILFLVVALVFGLYQRRTSQRLALAQSIAEAASSAKSDFLANMSHEIRTPMNGVLGMAELLEDSQLSKDQKVLVRTIRQSGVALLSIINDILDFSKIEAGKLELMPEPVNLPHLLDDCVALLRTRADERHLALDTEYGESLPSTVVVDGGRLRQILLNLIGNGIKFTHAGTVRVVVLGRVEGSSVVLQFAVSDTGIGISANKLEHIFEQFSQAESNTTKKYGGTGLGLSISRSLVEAMGGTLAIQSAPDKGSTFSFDLKVPVLDANVEAVEPVQPVTVAANKKPLRILLADDNKVNRVIAERMLATFGHGVESVNDGEEAVALFQIQTFDLVLMDISMPVMDGLEATANLRRIEKEHHRRAIPILALTAHAMPGDRERFIEVGMNDHLTKPLTKSQLGAALQLWGHRELEAAESA